MLYLYVKSSNEYECKGMIHLKQQKLRKIFHSYINTEDNNLKHLYAEANSIKTYPV